MPTILNLENILKPWARQMFQITKDKGSKKLDFDDCLVTFNWEGVEFDVQPQETTKLQKAVQQANDESGNTMVLFKTAFDNETEMEQEYNFHVNRETNCVFELELSSGYSIGSEVGVSFKCPGDLFELSAGFQYEYSLSKTTRQSFSETITWGAESRIVVPPRHRALAALTVTENKADCEFASVTKASGTVGVVFTDPSQNNCFVRHLSGNLADVISKNYAAGLGKPPSSPSVSALQMPPIFVSDGIVYLVTKGKSNFRFGAEQKIKVYHEPL